MPVGDRRQQDRPARPDPHGRRRSQAAADLGLDAEVFPISAARGKGIGPLVEHLVELAPEGPFLFPLEEISDQPEHVRAGRARARAGAAPHAPGGPARGRGPGRRDRSSATTSSSVHALLWVETESQKGILIGRRGAMIKAIGTASRRELEHAVGMRVHLDLSVRVRRSWRADDALLDRLGIN